MVQMTKNIRDEYRRENMGGDFYADQHELAGDRFEAGRSNQQSVNRMNRL